jgi:hypothetical protein
MKSVNWRVFGLLAVVALFAVSYSKAAESKSIVVADGADASADSESAPTTTVAAPQAVAETVAPTLVAEQPPVVTPAPRSAPARTAVARAVPSASRTSVNADAYTVKVSVPASVAAGDKGTVRVTVEVKSGWKLNQEFPTKLVVTAPGDVTLEKAKLRAKDATSFSKKKGVFDVVFTPSASGGKDFSAKLRFAVCTDATCDPKTEKLSWQVSVK